MNISNKRAKNNFGIFVFNFTIDDISTFVLENVSNIQWNGSNNTWSIMFDDYETQEVDGQILEINQD